MINKYTLQRWAGISTRQIVMIAATFLSLFPIYFMLISSFKTQDEYRENTWGLPTIYTLKNFVTSVGQEKFAERFVNSAILTIGAVLISSLFACLAAYAFARMNFRGKHTIFNLILALMVIPPVVMITPLFVSLVRWDLINYYQGVILIYTGLLLPFSIFLMTNFFKTIPREIVEAARIDGCSSLNMFWKILIPLSAPAIITMIVVNALWVWNELLIALVFLQKDEMKTVMVSVAAMRGRYYLDIPATMAGLLIATVPIILLYLFGQRYFIQGLTSGAVK